MIIELFYHPSGLLPASTQSIPLTFLTILIKISVEGKDVCLCAQLLIPSTFEGTELDLGAARTLKAVVTHLLHYKTSLFRSPQCSVKIFPMYDTMWKKLAILFGSFLSGDWLVGNTLNFCLSEVGFILGSFCQDSLAGYKTLAFQFSSPDSSFGTLIILLLWLRSKSVLVWLLHLVFYY